MTIIKHYYVNGLMFDFGRLVQQFAEIHNLGGWNLQCYEFVYGGITNERLAQMDKFVLSVDSEDSPILAFVESLSLYFVRNGDERFSGRFRWVGTYGK